MMMMMMMFLERNWQNSVDILKPANILNDLLKSAFFSQ
jgi:hypothetical protein